MLNTTLHMVPLLKPLISITLIAFIVYITITTSLKKKISTRVAASSILQSATPDRAHGVIFGKEKGAVFSLLPMTRDTQLCSVVAVQEKHQVY